MEIHANSYYVDAAHSIVDPRLEEQNKEVVKPFEDFLKKLSAITDRYSESGGSDPKIAQCALHWLDAWAKGRAMLGAMDSNQSQYERKWMLAGLSMSYLKIQGEPSLPELQKQEVENWLQQLAEATIAFYQNPRLKHNNHYYWAGLAVAATGVAAQDRALFDWGLGTFREALTQLTPEGTLPLEMERAGKALAYHNFSVAPLVLIAELAEANGVGLYTEKGKIFFTLVRRTLEGLRDPKFFQEATKVKQEIPKGGILGWMEAYEARFPSEAVESMLRLQRPYVYPRLGGNLTLLFARSNRAQ